MIIVLVPTLPRKLARPITSQNIDHTMIKVFLTIDPYTLRALYDDEAKLLGVFQSMSEAEDALGDMLNFCTIHHEAKN
ncbi:MAG: hypothetical protein A2061_04950 [Gallionellales bacterium GWA2_59_43]|nr:MAG: hypothetical protein A2061_04950 [Gallionellales bacterium GWA2_59_43]